MCLAKFQPLPESTGKHVLAIFWPCFGLIWRILDPEYCTFANQHEPITSSTISSILKAMYTKNMFRLCSDWCHSTEFFLLEGLNYKVFGLNLYSSTFRPHFEKIMCNNLPKNAFVTSNGSFVTFNLGYEWGQFHHPCQNDGFGLKLQSLHICFWGVGIGTEKMALFISHDTHNNDIGTIGFLSSSSSKWAPQNAHGCRSFRAGRAIRSAWHAPFWSV